MAAKVQTKYLHRVILAFITRCGIYIARYVVGTTKKHFSEMLLMSTPNMFSWRKVKYLSGYFSYLGQCVEYIRNQKTSVGLGSDCTDA